MGIKSVLTIYFLVCANFLIAKEFINDSVTEGLIRACTLFNSL